MNSTDPRPGARRQYPAQFSRPPPALRRGVNGSTGHGVGLPQGPQPSLSRTSSASSSYSVQSQTGLLSSSRVNEKSGSERYAPAAVAQQYRNIVPSASPNRAPAPAAANTLYPAPSSNHSHFSLGSNHSSRSNGSSYTEKFALNADPTYWNLSPDVPEDDDFLHNPNPARDRKNDQTGSILTMRGMGNLGCLALLVISLVTLFAGYPIITRYAITGFTQIGSLNIGGTNETGQIPLMSGANFGLIDADTPESAYSKPSYTDPSVKMNLVFSDEFNVEGRTFYEGDDPYWEAVDLHYWATNNLEWYDPAAVTTKGGNLVITLSREESHGLNYQGGMITTWNKFCFTGGLFEVNAILPGASDVEGLWPAVWAMGNLGRAGYGASLEGVWPYTYDSCDVGTLPNQTTIDGLPVSSTEGNDAFYGSLSFQPGQRLSACTCDGEIHPGPKKADGSFAGRGAPEIDVFEATVDPKGNSFVSQSSQWAPYNHKYTWNNNSETLQIYNSSQTALNEFIGGVYQQTTSCLVKTNAQCGYEASGANACYEVYGFEYAPGNDGYITWISSGAATWTMRAAGMAADPISEVSQRPIPGEPMYLIANLGMSFNFGPIDFPNLNFPHHLYIDYVRVYQEEGKENLGCSPPDFPTSDYIDTFIEAYTNANLTTWEQYGQTMPKNSLLDGCARPSA